MYRIDMSWRAIAALVVGTALWRADVLLPAQVIVRAADPACAATAPASRSDNSGGPESSAENGGLDAYGMSEPVRDVPAVLRF